MKKVYSLNKIKRTIILLYLAFTMCFFLVLNVFGQGSGESKTIPAQDTFEPTIDLIALDTTIWRENINESFRLYNADGSLWYEFSLGKNHPLYFEKLSEFKLTPIFPVKYGYFRLKAVSKNWYEIEIDEVTGHSKYLRVDSRYQKRESIVELIGLSSELKFNQEKNPLHDKPDGTIRSYKLFGSEICRPVGGVKGDWLQVEIFDSVNKNRYDGWIVWRRDNRLVISFELLSLDIFSVISDTP